jgi:hypothetical protein
MFFNKEKVNKVKRSTCSECNFFEEHECHRYPPQNYISEITTNKGWVNDFSSRIEQKSRYTSVTENDWCGEFIARSLE